MTRFPDQEQAIQAWRASVDALQLARDASLKGSEISVFGKFLLVQGLQAYAARPRGEASRNSLRSHLESRLGALRLALRLDGDFVRDFCQDSLQARQFLHSSGLCQKRLIDLALAALVSESLAPEICLEFAPWTVDDLAGVLHGKRNHAVIFADAILFHHEFYPLAVDAYVRDAERFGAPRTNVVGAHVDWLSPDGMLKRILFLDADHHCFREADLVSPIHADSAQFHSLGSNEQTLHQQWSDRSLCPQVNPYGPSSLADDKAATLVGWSALGVDVPAFVKVAAGDSAGAWRFAKAYRELVVKPNQSTEGDGVAYFNVGQNNFAADFAKHLVRCWHQGDALVQQRRDGLIFADPRSGTRHNLVLRLNLAVAGDGYQVASGYAQIAVDTGQPAAASQGGRIVSPLEILDGLRLRTDSASPVFKLQCQDWMRICDQAIWAAGLFRGLMLVGIDVLLDVDLDGNIMPVLLEANPRPAGLCHSRLLDGYPDSCPALNGVSLKLWDGLERVHEKATVHAVEARGHLPARDGD